MADIIIEYLSSIPMIVIAGVCLIINFFVPSSNNWPLNPVSITVFICGLPILYEALEKIIHKHGLEKISSSLLVSIAMIASIIIGDMFAAGEVAFIMALGEILEDLTVERAKKGIKNLMALAPTQARKIIGGDIKIVDASEIKLNDVLRVLPGEKIPADGIIINGHTSINQAIVTGESLPVDKNVNDNVFCGTLNFSGAIEIKVTGAGDDSSLQKMIKMVEDAGSKQAKIQLVADKWASILVPAALLIAVAGYFATGNNIIRAVTVLVVFCPCALVLATPTAIIAAIGQASKKGVIIKSGEALENMNDVTVAAFDKTGTISSGKLQVSDIFTTDIYNEEELIKIAASIENYSEHPLAKAVVEFAKDKNITHVSVNNFVMEAGQGVSAIVYGEKFYCGNDSFMASKNIKLSDDVNNALKKLRSQGKASIIISNSNECAGIIALSDVIRPGVKDCMNKLSNMGLKTVLISGDNVETAKYFADMAGIDFVEAGLLPEGKVKAIQEFQMDGEKVFMTGDGVNDAPVLKMADLGIAMGGAGSDITADAADIVLMNDDVSKIPYLKKLAASTVKTIKAGIFLSLAINFIAIILSLQGLLNPTTGALVHNAGSFIVIFIAAMLYDKKIDA